MPTFFKKECRLNGFSFFAEFIQFSVTEIERNVNGYFNEVQYVEEEAEIEHKGAEAGCCGITEGRDLNYFSRDTESISYEKEYFEEQRFTFCGSGNKGFADRYGP